MPVWGSVYFQNSVSFVMEQLLFFHDYTMVVLIGVMMVVGYFLWNSVVSYSYNRGIHEGQQLEGLWTVVPGVLLLFIVFPSLRVLYYMEEADLAEVAVSVVGHQWFWSYEYGGVGGSAYDSYMSGGGVIRLLGVDSSLLVPYLLGLRLVISASDVIHSWTVPSTGGSVDAVPGRLNQVSTLFNRPGIFVGQCSEICGANHSFMPVTTSVVSCGDFLKWLYQ